MRKRAVLTVLTVGLVLGLAGSAWASEVGNIAESGRFRLELKAEHQVREINLKEPFTAVLPERYPDENEMTIPSLTYQSFDGEETIDRYYVKGSLAVTDNLEFFGKFGVGRLKFTFFDPKLTLVLDHYESVPQSPPAPGNGPDEEEWEYVGTTFFEWLNHPMMGKGEWGTFYGGGIKFILLRRPDFKVGFDAQYLCQEADCQVDLTEAASGDMVSSEKDILQETLTKTGTTEWQVAVILSGTMGRLSPYGGVKWSQYYTSYTGEWRATHECEDCEDESGSVTIYDFKFETESEDSLGIFVGAEYSLTDTCGLNAELRLGDEFAATAGFFRTF